MVSWEIDPQTVTLTPTIQEPRPETTNGLRFDIPTLIRVEAAMEILDIHFS